jgi:hypothetical protein
MVSHFMFWVWPLLFLASVLAIRAHKIKKADTVEAQFVLTGCLLFVFYSVCFLSGICTILNFIWRWVL